MKKLFLIALVFISIFSFSLDYKHLTPTSDIIGSGRISVDSFFPGGGIRFGLFDFIETGISASEEGVYFKVGFNQTDSMPISFAAGYSKTLDYYGSAILFTTIGTGNDFYNFKIGGKYNQHYSTDDNIVSSYGVYSNFGLKFKENDFSKSILAFDVNLNLDNKFGYGSFSGGIYGNENFKQNFWVFEQISLLAGLTYSPSSFDKFDIFKDINVIIGMSSQIKLF